MKKIVLGLVAFALGFTSMAQTTDSASSADREFHRRHKLQGQNFDRLNLTTDQKAQIKTLNQSLRQQIEDLNKNTNLSTNDLKEKRETLIKEHREKIAAILTPAQRQQAREMRKEFGNEDKGEKKGKKFEEMTKDLNLTPEQTAKMKELNSTFRNNIQSIRKNTALTREEKKEQMKSLMKKHKEDMETLLTNEQKEQLKNNRKNRRSIAANNQ